MSTINGKYVLERVIGRGASGTVWIARDTTLGRHVAVKILRSDAIQDATAQELFQREARTIAQLKSEHVVVVHDFGVHDSNPYIVMELLDGEGLDVRLDRQQQGRLPFAMAARIVADVARGLAVTHRQGIVHRDLKPGNIFLAREGGGEIAKLLDFGIAVLTPQAEARAWCGDCAEPAAGTPHYSSPEQLAAGEIDHRTDLWALGVVVYQLLTGTFPFDGSTMQELRAAVGSGVFAAPSSIVPQLGLATDAFFARALALDPAARFQSATDFATELVGLSDTKRPVISALFIDDEPDMELLVRHQFRRELREGRYEFHFALDGQAGMDELRRRPEIDVVFTDLNMPNMDGLTFLRRVPEVNPLVRVVVVSAYSDMSNIRAAMNLGAFDFLGKPIDFDDLERTMTKCASGAPSLRQSLRAREENDIVRALVGASAVDRLVTSLRASRSVGDESFEGTVAFVRIPDFEDLHAAHLPATTIYDHLNAHFELFGPDILAHGGVVARFINATLLAVFRGEGHLVRALDACLAIRERMRALPPQMTRGMLSEGGASIGLDTGLLMAGGMGSLAIGRIEQTLLGDPVLNAGRLVIVAGRNEILVPARVQTLSGSLFAYEPQEGPGAEAPAVMRVIGRPRAGSTDGARAPLDTKAASSARVPTVIGRG